MAEDVEATDYRPLCFAKCLGKLNAGLIGSKWLVRRTLKIFKILTKRILASWMYRKPLLHDGDAS